MISTLLVLAAASVLPVAGEPPPLTPVEDAYPCLNADGTRLVFESTRSGRWALYLSDPDGRNMRMFLDSGDDPVVPVWSPDGRRIAFAATVDGQSEVFVMNADGTGRTRLTRGPGDDSHPHWAADGSRIYFNSSRTTPDPKAEWGKQWHEVFSMKLDGSDLRQHTHCRTVCTYPVPSPDGRRIAYRKIIDAPGLDWALKNVSRNSEVFVADMDGSHELNLSAHAAYDGYPMWSPDGKWIVFSSARIGVPNAGQLLAIRPDGSDLRPITGGSASYVQPSFAPDGKSLYASRTFEAFDWSWTYSYLVHIPVDGLLE